jgi:hypothetical protein
VTKRIIKRTKADRTVSASKKLGYHDAITKLVDAIREENRRAKTRSTSEPFKNTLVHALKINALAAEIQRRAAARAAQTVGHLRDH